MSHLDRPPGVEWTGSSGCGMRRGMGADGRKGKIAGPLRRDHTGRGRGLGYGKVGRGKVGLRKICTLLKYWVNPDQTRRARRAHAARSSRVCTTDGVVRTT